MHTTKIKVHKNDQRRRIMKWSCYLYFLACLFTLSKAQGPDEGCITCAVGKFFETGLEDWILPTAAGALQFLVPDSSPTPDAFPKEPDKQWTNNNPGTVNEPDIEILSIDDKKCDPNGAGALITGRSGSGACGMDWTQT